MLVKTKESDPSLIDKCKFCTHTELTESQFLPLQANFPHIFSHEKKLRSIIYDARLWCTEECFI